VRPGQLAILDASFGAPLPWPMDDGRYLHPDRTLLAAVATAVVLLVPSAGIVTFTTHEPMGWSTFLIAVVVADMVLCIFLGLACMVLGYAVAAIKGEWSQPRPLLGFAAALTLIFLTVGRLVATMLRGGPSSGQPPSTSGL